MTTVMREGIAYTDGAMHVRPVGNAAITGGSGVPILIAQSGAAITAPTDTNENTLVTVNIAAGVMGANGRLRFRFFATQTGSDNKTTRIKLGGTQLFSSVRNTTTTLDVAGELMNMNATDSQRTTSFVEITSGAITFAAQGTAAIDTAAATTLTLTMQKVTGADAFVIRGYYVELIKPVA